MSEECVLVIHLNVRKNIFRHQIFLANIIFPTQLGLSFDKNKVLKTPQGGGGFRYQAHGLKYFHNQITVNCTPCVYAFHVISM